MTYRATNESSDLSHEERIAEARKIVIDMDLQGHTGDMTAKESGFVLVMANDLGLGHANVSIKQLWWLRDLKDKYLL